MKKLGVIYGCEEQARPIVVGESTVYEHSNVTPVESEITNSKIYSYEETQYSKNEYIELLATKNAMLEKQLTQIQSLLTEVCEKVGIEVSNILK